MNLAIPTSPSPPTNCLVAQSKNNDQQHGRRFSATISAFLVFAAISWTFHFFARAANLDRFELSQHSWAWWAAKCERDRQSPADVLLMGSSLVQRLLNEGEATYLHKTIGALSHRRSCQLESLLSAGLHRPVKTFSYAIGGLHASDASVVTSVLLQGTHQPGTIIYGIAPRDLMNCLLASPSATETFQLLNKIEEQKDVALIARTSTGEKFDYVAASILSKLLPLFDFHTELAQCFRRAARHDLNAIVNQFVPHPQNPFCQADLIALKMLPEELDADIPIHAFDPEHPGYEDNRLVYLSAYKPFRAKFYSLQKRFLDRLMQTCNQRGIQLILVNMPLRKDNFEAMDAGFYDRFHDDVKQLARTNHVPFIDMQTMCSFPFADFSDQVHLNGRGAVRFIQALTPHLIPLLENQAVASTKKSTAFAE